MNQNDSHKIHDPDHGQGHDHGQGQGHDHHFDFGPHNHDSEHPPFSLDGGDETGLDIDEGMDHGEFNCLYGHLFNADRDQETDLQETVSSSSSSSSSLDSIVTSTSHSTSSVYSSSGRTMGLTGSGEESGSNSLLDLLWSSRRGRRRSEVVVTSQNSDQSVGQNGIASALSSSSSSFLSASASAPSPWAIKDYDEGHGKSTCNRTWDGLLCWPQTLEGTQVSLPCFKHFRGISYDERGTVTRLCQEGGIWHNQTTDYSQCIPKPHPNLNEQTFGTHDVYFVGYCCSLLALIIAMTIFLAFKELRCLRNKIHTHLIITYILADGLWLITSIQSHVGHQTQVSCISFILLHYVHLTNFFWMFVEGFYLYILVVQTFIAEHVKFRIYASIGWGSPFLVVIVWSLAKWLDHSPATEVPKIDTDIEIPSCFWLTVSVYDWIYKSPAILILLANSIFLLQIMWVLITKLRSATNPETQQSRKAAKAMVVLMPLFGITYVLVLRGSSQTPAYEITRALLISTQGFLVALLFCFLNGEVRIAIRHRWNRLELGCWEGRSHRMQMRDWAPRSRTESIRLYTPTQTPSHQRKRESTTSDTTMTTVLGSTNGQPLIVTTVGSSRKSPILTKTYNPSENNSLL